MPTQCCPARLYRRYSKCVHHIERCCDSHTVLQAVGELLPYFMHFLTGLGKDRRSCLHAMPLDNCECRVRRRSKKCNSHTGLIKKFRPYFVHFETRLAKASLRKIYLRFFFLFATNSVKIGTVKAVPYFQVLG